MGNSPTKVFSMKRFINIKYPSNTMQGRWVLKSTQHENINSYWNNIDNCGDKICGNIKETKIIFENEIMRKEIVKK